MKNAENPKTIGVKAKASSRERDETFQLMSWWKKDLVRNAKVMVVGAGALGNEVLKNLALLNVGHILIVDFDTIEYANLSRSVLFRESDCDRKKCEVAAEQVKDINPHVKVQAVSADITADMGLGVFRAMDVIVGCLDNRIARLFLNRACHKVNKTWIDAGIQDMAGQIYAFKPGKTCYECTLTRRDKALIEYRLSCTDVANYHASQGRIATTPISASIFGAMQAQEALKAIHGDEKYQMLEEYLFYEGRTNTVIQRQYPALKALCTSHFCYDSIIESPLSSETTLSQALDWLADYFRDNTPQIELDNELVTGLTTRESEVSYEVLIPKPHLKGDMITQFQKIPGEALVLNKMVQRLDREFPRQELTLKQCGIPPLHIIQVLTNDGPRYVELSADKEFINFQ